MDEHRSRLYNKIRKASKLSLHLSPILRYSLKPVLSDIMFHEMHINTVSVCLHNCAYTCACMAVAMWSCSYHHYLGQYPHVHILISPSMSNEGSQAAAQGFVDLFEFLLRPHSKISSSSVKDPLQGKIIGSQTVLQALLNIHLIIQFQVKCTLLHEHCPFGFFSERNL